MSAQDSGARCVSLTGIRKAFGHVVALNGASLDIPLGQVTALVGDNGAGKSSLMKTLAGVHQPDSGSVSIDGREVQFNRPSDARAYGIQSVYQDLALAENLDIVENLFLGSEPKLSLAGFKVPWVDRRRMEAEAAALLLNLGITTIQDLNQEIQMLSGGQRQTIAIARAIKDRADLVILDEPTAALGVIQASQVMENIRKVKALGTGILLISHNLREVFAVSDRIAVMRLGRVVSVFAASTVTEHEVVSAIVGSRQDTTPQEVSGPSRIEDGVA